jgi:hypothetical protein
MPTEAPIGTKIIAQVKLGVAETVATGADSDIDCATGPTVSEPNRSLDEFDTNEVDAGFARVEDLANEPAAGNRVSVLSLSWEGVLIGVVTRST